MFSTLFLKVQNTAMILLIIKKSTVGLVITNLSKKFAKHFTITASELCLTAFLIMWEEISLLYKVVVTCPALIAETVIIRTVVPKVYIFKPRRIS